MNTSPQKHYKWEIPSENKTTFRSGWSSNVKISAPTLPITISTQQYDPSKPNEVLPPLKEGQNPYIITNNFAHLVQLVLKKQKASRESKETQSIDAKSKLNNGKHQRIVFAIDRSYSMKEDENWRDATESSMFLAHLLFKNKVLNRKVSLNICFFDDFCSSYHYVKSMKQLKEIFQLPENQPNGGTDFATLIEEVWKSHQQPPKRPHKQHKHHHHSHHTNTSPEPSTDSSKPPGPTKHHHHHHHHHKPKNVDTRLFIFTDGAPSDISIEQRTEKIITHIANTIKDINEFFITFYQIGNCDKACEFLQLLDTLNDKERTNAALLDIVDRVSAFSRGEADGHVFSHLLRCCSTFKDLEV